ncbi:MAG: lipid A export permease/ATP-binding protein MsbA [Negativicutes bacterium]|nr:lipid A export permease/ATP-binding protein MsbA [Negativicutes bacterium]
MKLYWRILSYLKPYWRRMVLAVLCIVLAAACNLYVPWIIKDVIDDVLSRANFAKLNLIAAGIVVLYLFRGVFFYFQTYLMSYIGQRVVIDVREELYRHLQRLSLAFFERRQAGEVMSYITNDVAAMQAALADSVIELVTEGTTLIGSLVYMFYINWELTLLTLVTLPAVAHAINVFGRKMRSTSHSIQERAADITAVLQETITAVRVIRSFAREDYEIGRFNRENFRNFRIQMKGSQLIATVGPVIEFLAAIGVTIIIWYGGHEVIAGQLTSGALIAFLIYCVNLSNPIKRLSRVYGNIQRSLAAAQRVFAVIDTQPEIADRPDAVELVRARGEVEFREVSFSYFPGELVLSQVNLRIKPGQMVALVGPSGAGKTTLANLLPRFYDATAGQVLVDGRDVRDFTVRSLRSHIGIVPQETMLFNGTIYENILYGRLDAGEDEVVAAARAANAHEFISQMPDGYQTRVGDRGSTLSGGQRQRVAIARAILKNPQILILDEATSALDAESERLVQEALDRMMVGRTSLVIAHRLSTVQRADLIVVLERGRIVEQGRHEQLINLGGLYTALYKVQFNEADLLPDRAG